MAGIELCSMVAVAKTLSSGSFMDSSSHNQSAISDL
jgi:hypothetical protein